MGSKLLHFRATHYWQVFLVSNGHSASTRGWLFVRVFNLTTYIFDDPKKCVWLRFCDVRGEKWVVSTVGDHF